MRISKYTCAALAVLLTVGGLVTVRAEAPQDDVPCPVGTAPVEWSLGWLTVHGCAREDGSRHGLARAWDANQELVFETRFVDGEQDLTSKHVMSCPPEARATELPGPHIGPVSQVYACELPDGTAHGPRYGWTSFGWKDWEDHWDQGKLHGSRKEWSRGRKSNEVFYLEGKPLRQVQWYITGSVKKRIDFVNGEISRSTEYYPNGKKKTEVIYERGNRVSETDFPDEPDTKEERN